MTIYEIAITAALAIITGLLFWKGHVKSGAVGVGAMVGYLVGVFTKQRPAELTPMQHLDKVEREVKEAKEQGDDAVIATVAEPDHTKTRGERWKDL